MRKLDRYRIQGPLAGAFLRAELRLEPRNRRQAWHHAVPIGRQYAANSAYARKEIQAAREKR
ncbi:hypothetical protein VE23_18940 [Paenibacillus sp. D9]|nr:hypothetical protein VE23_18940 [Paenibacillus sp. D9]